MGNVGLDSLFYTLRIDFPGTIISYMFSPAGIFIQSSFGSHGELVPKLVWTPNSTATHVNPLFKMCVQTMQIFPHILGHIYYL